MNEGEGDQPSAYKTDILPTTLLASCQNDLVCKNKIFSILVNEEVLSARDTTALTEEEERRREEVRRGGEGSTVGHQGGRRERDGVSEETFNR